MLGGALAPLAVTVVLATIDDPQIYRPGTILMAVIIAAAVFLGFRAGVAATAISSVGVWWLSERSPMERGGTAELVSLALFVLAATGVLVLVSRIEDGRRAERRQRLIADALLDATPVGIGLVEPDLTFERVNQRLAEIDGSGAADHVGRRPRELNPVAGDLFEPLLTQVRDTGAAVDGRELSLENPETGVDRHWRASSYPINPERGGLVGIGITVEETTGEVIARRRSERLLSLARDLAQVVDRDQLVVAVCRGSWPRRSWHARGWRSSMSTPPR